MPIVVFTHLHTPNTHIYMYTQTPHPTHTNEFHIQVKAVDMAARATARGRTAVRAASTVVDFVFESTTVSSTTSSALKPRSGYAHYPLAQWRNGQWADPMLAHAGTEAVRLVPFSSLLLSAESLSEYRSSAWRLPLCQDAVRIICSTT